MKKESNNAEITKSKISSSRSNPFGENEDQNSENLEKKSLNPDSALVIQDLLTLLYSNKNNDLNV